VDVIFFVFYVSNLFGYFKS